MIKTFQMHQHPPLSGTTLGDCVYSLYVPNKVSTPSVSIKLSQDKNEADKEFFVKDKLCLDIHTASRGNHV